MEEKEISIEILLKEYNKYIMSRLINKEYDFNELRQIVKKFSEDTELIEYSDQMTNQEVATSIQKFISESMNESMNGKKFEI